MAYDTPRGAISNPQPRSRRRWGRTHSQLFTRFAWITASAKAPQTELTTIRAIRNMCPMVAARPAARHGPATTAVVGLSPPRTPKRAMSP